MGEVFIISLNQFSNYITQCIESKTSDLYILPNETGYRVMFNSQIQLTTLDQLNKEEGNQLITYLKYRANMAVSEHRRPQVGAILWEIKQQKINLRLSSVGDFKGNESLVVRFIYPLAQLKNQQLVPQQWSQLEQIISRRGLVLFSGPMGSGKTTTMYQLAQHCCQSQIVMTIEDPVEIQEPNFIQLQVNDRAQMNYEQLLKVGLRHRPDVFIIGEIRDEVTAKMAVKAALSGHLVMATVHAQNTFGVVNRMLQLGVAPEYLEQVIQGICYQRLLPMTNDQFAVLYDLLSDAKLELAFDKTNKGMMTSEWEQQLEQCKHENKITKTTAQKYRWG